MLRLFKKNSFESKSDINLSEIVSISRTCDRMLVSIEEYFRSEYSKQEGFKEHSDPHFIVTWLVSLSFDDLLFTFNKTCIIFFLII